MTIQELLDKVSEESISLWDLKNYALEITDANRG